MPHGRLLNNDAHNRKATADVAYPAVLLQSSESRSHCLVEGFRCNLDCVLDVVNISDGNSASAKSHVAKRNIFAFSSLTGAARLVARGETDRATYDEESVND
ncbi:MAG: hypothetical protein JO249_09175 [Acidobacteria bacterium]|nr:hypothetical protein [Acidobacteriota bacterium]MBV9480910.1 hypothetical protein [Acidobacteriota bacterium]